MPKLSIALENAKATHELTEEKISIGRAPDNLVQIDDPSVSGRHARLLLVGERYQLKDLGSTNGTRVNGEAITEIFLRVGDRVRFGKVDARYESDATGEAQAQPEADEIEARPAETSAKPADFANASPFPDRKKEKDTVGTAVLAAAGVAVLLFLLSMLSLLRMHGRCRAGYSAKRRRISSGVIPSARSARKLSASCLLARRLPNESVTRGA
jgi:predicted component of type VI protein secretion system